MQTTILSSVLILICVSSVFIRGWFCFRGMTQHQQQHTVPRTRHTDPRERPELARGE